MADYKTVAAYFASHSAAESAITELKEAGFQPSQIGIAAGGTDSSGLTSSAGAEAEGTAYKAGHAAGNAWEKFKAMFEGNAAEPYAGEKTRENFNDNVITPDPAYAPEDVTGSFAGMSVPEEHSRYFGHRLSTGDGAVVTVNAAGRDDEALQILEANGGDVGAKAAGYDYSAAAPSATGGQTIQLFGEVLRVHKDRVNRGEVRLRKEVVTTPQTVEVPVTREELVVERVPVTGQSAVPSAAAGSAFRGEEIRIPLSEERASVTKEAVVREEVRVGKREVSNVETLRDDVRREELTVEQGTGSPIKTGSR